METTRTLLYTFRGSYKGIPQGKISTEQPSEGLVPPLDASGLTEWNGYQLDASGLAEWNGEILDNN